MPGKPTEPASKYSHGSFQLRSGDRPLQIAPLDSPPRIVRPKRIHSRRLLPFVVEGEERRVHSQSARAIIHQPRDVGRPDIALVRNTALRQAAQNQTSSTVGEPSLAVNGDVVLFTGNWYSAFSLDAGQTFRFLDPNAMAQPHDPAGVTFCCDQVVNYMPQIDTFVWLLQYGPSTGDNIQRLAFATTPELRAGRWRVFDISPQSLGVPGFFLDYPDLAVGSNFLYMTTNCFGPNDAVGSAVVRIPIAAIAQGTPAAEHFLSMDLFSFRVAQNCASTAFFAAHRDTSTLAVFSWPEDQNTPVATDIAVARWLGTNGYFSRTPDGRRWLDRADPRITGATIAGGEVWFAWGVDANSNHRPKPFVQMARIDARTLQLIEDVNLFDTDSATCYAGLSSNARGEIGVSYMIGGAVFPSHVVGILGTDRQSVMVTAGDRGPLPDEKGHFEWGDYLTTRPVFPDRKLFGAAGYVLTGLHDGGNVDATPHFVMFGRTADVQATGTPETGIVVATTGDTAVGADGAGLPPPGQPITDVNTLNAVSSAVAKKIKAACGVHAPVHAFEAPAAPMPQLVTKPGVERWPVKTGQDQDRHLVGRNIIAGVDLGAGVVLATVEELISMPRPKGFENPKTEPPQFQHRRALPAESVIWRIEGNITVLKLEKDGDYHLVVQGASGDTLVAEVPTATVTFVGDSPWRQNMKDARRAIDDKLVHTLNPHDFVLPPGGSELVPRNSLSAEAMPPAGALSFPMPASFKTPDDPDTVAMPAFKTAIPSTPARITGVGFFDRMHGQTGVAPNVIELHPILKIEFL